MRIHRGKLALKRALAAALLADHPVVANVQYPGLPSHVHHKIAPQLVGHQIGGM